MGSDPARGTSSGSESQQIWRGGSPSRTQRPPGRTTYLMFSRMSSWISSGRGPSSSSRAAGRGTLPSHRPAGRRPALPPVGWHGRFPFNDIADLGGGRPRGGGRWRRAPPSPPAPAVPVVLYPPYPSLPLALDGSAEGGGREGPLRRPRGAGPRAQEGGVGRQAMASGMTPSVNWAGTPPLAAGMETGNRRMRIVQDFYTWDIILLFINRSRQKRTIPAGFFFFGSSFELALVLSFTLRTSVWLFGCGPQMDLLSTKESPQIHERESAHYLHVNPN